MFLQDHWEVKTKSDNSDDETLPFENISDGDIEYSVEGESLVIWCALKFRLKRMIIDVGSYANIASTILVRKLNLNTTKH